MTPLFKVKLPVQRHSRYPLTIAECLAAYNAPLQWLHDNKRYDHLINTYWNDERGITFVFSDATTATLFRLSH